VECKQRREWKGSFAAIILIQYSTKDKSSLSTPRGNSHPGHTRYKICGCLGLSQAFSIVIVVSGAPGTVGGGLRY
jgi:hypothetical protein